MTSRILIAYRTILETANELEEKIERRDGQMSSSFYGQHAAGLRTAAAIIKGVCNDNTELSEQLKEIRNELEQDEGRKTPDD